MAESNKTVESGRTKTEHADIVERSWPKLRFAALVYIQASTSSLDWVLGPLFPAIQAHYGLPYRTAALLLIAQMLGAPCPPRLSEPAGAYVAFPLNIAFGSKIGLKRLLPIGVSLMLIASVVSCFAIPFPVFVILYGGWGLGQIVTRTQIDSRAVSCVIARRRTDEPSLTGSKSRVMINCQHAGNVFLGGVTAAVATAMISKGLPFQRFYIVGSGLLAVSLLVSFLVALLPTEQFEAHAPDAHDALNADGSRRTRFVDIVHDAASVPQLAVVLAFAVCYVYVLALRPC